MLPILLLFLLAGCVGSVEDPSTDVPARTQAAADYMRLAPECAKYEAYFQPVAPSAFPYLVILDAAMSDTNIQLMLDAVDGWNTEMDQEVVYTTITYNMNRHPDCNYAILKEDVLSGNVVGLTTYGTCANDLIQVETHDVVPDAFHGNNRVVSDIAMHEIGHALGLSHEDNPNSIMNPWLDEAHQRWVSEQSRCLVNYAIFKSKHPTFNKYLLGVNTPRKPA